MTRRQHEHWLPTPERVLWQDQALCREIGPDTFYADHASGASNDYGKAKDVCDRCPVTTECLDFALETRAVEGIWGGLNEAERRAERKRRTA